MREGYFSVRGRPTELKPPVDWRMDPIENRSWRAWLHTMRFLAVPLLAYEQEGDGDRRRFLLPAELLNRHGPPVVEGDWSE